MIVIHVEFLYMWVLFYSSFVCIPAYAYDFKSKVHCGSALGPEGATLLLHTTCIRSQRLGGASTVVVKETNKKEAKSFALFNFNFRRFSSQCRCLGGLEHRKEVYQRLGPKWVTGLTFHVRRETRRTMMCGAVKIGGVVSEAAGEP